MISTTKTMMGKFRLSLAISLLVGAIIPAGLASGNSGSVNTTRAYHQFCTPHLLRDFERRLSRFPKVHIIPKSGLLPFGPKRLELNSVPDNLEFGKPPKAYFFKNMVVGPGQVGYIFSDREHAGSFSLGWTVSAQIQLLDGNGHVRREVDQKRLWIGKINYRNDPSIVLNVGPAVGFYRFDVQFANRAKMVLGSFSRYVRVVRPRLQARLGINGSSFRHEDLVAVRVENLGTEEVSDGQRSRIERLDGNRWIDQSQLITVPYLAGQPEVRGSAPGGWSDFCSDLFFIPRGFTSGHYRIVKEVRTKAYGDGRETFDLAAEFDVVG